MHDRARLRFARPLCAAVLALCASSAMAGDPAPPMSSFAVRDAAGHRQVDAEDGAQPRLGCRLHEAHRAIQAVAIGQGDGRLAILRGTLDQPTLCRLVTLRIRSSTLR